MAVVWARVNQAAPAGDGAFALCRGPPFFACLQQLGEGDDGAPACVPRMPEALATAARVKRSRVGTRSLLISPSAVGVLALPPQSAVQSALSPPPAR